MSEPRIVHLATVTDGRVQAKCGQSITFDNHHWWVEQETKAATCLTCLGDIDRRAKRRIVVD